MIGKMAIAGALGISLGMALGLQTAQAGVSNAGFETGTSGWVSYGSSGATDSYFGFTPKYGSSFGYVTAGAGLNVYSTLAQTFTLLAGESIAGYVGFKADDYLPYDDKAILTISDGETITSLWSATVASVGDFGSTGWKRFSFTAAQGGVFTLSLGVKNVQDNVQNSVAFLDAPQSVPGPIAGAGIPALLGLMGLRLWRRKQAVAA